MADVAEHYDALLAEHYSWMAGMPIAAKAAEQRALLEGLGLGASGKRLAVDLGSGPGYQSIALAQMGFADVLAIDTSRGLLAELEAARGALPIRTVLGDMLTLTKLVAPGSADAIVCMGDTLTHLPARSDVSRLFADAYTALAPGGSLVLTFRDLSREAMGLDRFFPVRADADRIMLCVLDYEPETVVVNDLVHVRDGEGWTLHKSSYRKLRLSPQSLADELSALGFEIVRNSPENRLQTLLARKPL